MGSFVARTDLLCGLGQEAPISGAQLDPSTHFCEGRQRLGEAQLGSARLVPVETGALLSPQHGPPEASLTSSKQHPGTFHQPGG